jgi:hypothetical protein
MGMSLQWRVIVDALERALGRPHASRLRIEGGGTVSVFPAHGRYVSDIPDWPSLHTRSGDSVLVEEEPSLEPPSGAAPLEELRWRALLHDVHRDAGADPAPSRELLSLQSWPDLPQVPEELLPPLTRICALLWCKPTVGYLVARVLQAPTGETAVLLRALQERGHVAASAASPAAADAPTPDSPAADGSPATTNAPPPSIVTRLWQRLLRLEAA